MRKAFVLTYHSQMITGMDYNSNDHVALPRDLAVCRQLGFRCVRALDLVRALRSGNLDALPERCVVITLDDGAVFDAVSTEFPPFGPQQPMESILADTRPGFKGWRWGRPSFTATSFVIADTKARAEIATSMGDADWMHDGWWAGSQQRGVLDIGTHSWNHVHPSVSEMQDSPQFIEAFHLIRTQEMAQRQIGDAIRSVRARTNSEAARLFAYPYGQYNGFLIEEYLPKQEEAIAAFTIEGAPVTAQTNVWTIPRFAFNHHWKSPEALAYLLRQ